MGLLRFWIFLVTIALGIAVAALLLLPRMLGDEIEHEIDARLERTQHAATLLLRVNARNWIDTSAQVASDAVLGESLDQATKGPSDLALVHKTVQDRLHYFNESMKVDLVLATDAKGRVIARVGVEATVYKDNIDGYPVVGDALRGLRGDDTWSIGGKLFRVAASPVILRDRYVGSVVIGQEATAELAESMKNMLGADVVLLLRGRVIASTAPLPILDSLPAAASAHAAELAHNSRVAPFTVDSFAVALVAFAGDAADHQAVFALCSPRHASVKLPAMLLGLLRQNPRTLPWRMLAPVGGGALFVFLFAMLLIRVGAAGPMSRLARDAHALSRGELEQLPERSYGGKIGVAVRAINSTLARIGNSHRAVVHQSGSQHALMNAEPVTTPKLPPPPPPGGTAPTLPISTTQVPADFDEGQQTKNLEQWSQVSPGERRGVFTHTHTPLPPPMIAADSEPLIPAAHKHSVEGLRSMPNDGHQFSGPNTIVAGPPGAMPPTSPPRPPAARAPVGRSFEEPTSVESPSEALLLAASNDTNDEIETNFRHVFDEFVTTRQHCGETMDGVTLDKFVAKLRQNRAQLIQRYGCSNVRFQVYVRDGKTALKATPIP